MLLATQHTFHTKIYVEVASHIKVTSTLRGSKFRNRSVNWWPNVSTLQHGMCPEVLCCRKVADCFISCVFSVTVCDFQILYNSVQLIQILQRFIVSNFYHPNVGTSD